VQLGGAFDVEDANVCKLARDAPEMQPLSLLLEQLGALMLLLAEFFDLILVSVTRDTDVHHYVE
jgi:hypothetical protein